MIITNEESASTQESQWQVNTTCTYVVLLTDGYNCFVSRNTNKTYITMKSL
jgi:hypothetical protein